MGEGWGNALWRLARRRELGRRVVFLVCEGCSPSGLPFRSLCLPSLLSPNPSPSSRTCSQEPQPPPRMRISRRSSRRGPARGRLAMAPCDVFGGARGAGSGPSLTIDRKTVFMKRLSTLTGSNFFQLLPSVQHVLLIKSYSTTRDRTLPPPVRRLGSQSHRSAPLLSCL